MSNTYTVTFNNATEYDIDASGYDTIYLNNILYSNYNKGSDRLKILEAVNGEKYLRIKVNTDGAGAYKYINVHNFGGVGTIQADDAVLGDRGVSLNITGLVSNMDYPITTPTSDNNFAGSIYSDEINASTAGPVKETIWYKKKKKWYSYQQDTSIGVNIDASSGNDIITGSNYDDTIYGGAGDDKITAGTGNDVIVGGAGVNTVYLNNETPFGDDKYYITNGESIVFWMTAVGPQPGLARIGQDLVISVHDASDNFMGSMTIVDYFTVMVTTDNSVLKNCLIKSSDGTSWVIDVKAHDFSAYATQDLTGQNGTFLGTYMADTIDATNATFAKETVWYKKKKKWYSYEKDTTRGVTIDAGLGDDIIYGSNYDDTITAGLGDNTIYFKENFGNDVIYLTKNDSGTESLLLNFKQYIPTLTSADIRFEVVGEDLKLIAGDQGTVLLKGYAKDKYLANIMVKLDDGSGGISNINVTNDSNVKSRLVTPYTESSWYSDVIDASNAPEQTTQVKVKKKWRTVGTGDGVTINAGDGNDIITGSKYRDYIAGGSGTNTVWLKTTENFGDDYYYPTAAETLYLKLDGTEGNYSLSRNGQDLVVTVFGDNEKTIRRGSISVVGYYKNAVAGEVRIYNVNDLSGTLAPSTGDSGANKVVMEGHGGTYIGTRFNDDVNAEFVLPELETRYIKLGKKWYPTLAETDRGVTINTGAGNDTIKGSDYKDNITGGAGTNTLLASVEYEFSEDNYYLTAGEDLKIKYADGIGNAGDYTADLIGNDLVVTIWDDDHEGGGTEMGTIIIKDYGSADLANSIKIYNQSDVEVANLKTEVTGSSITRKINNPGTYYGTRLNDKFNFYDVTEEMTSVKIKKKWRQVGTGRGVTVDTGAGVDEVTGSRFNDTFITGTGTETIILNQDFGNDTIYVSDGSIVTIDIKAFGYTVGTIDDAINYSISNGSMSVSIGNHGTLYFANLNEVQPSVLQLQYTNSDSYNLLADPAYSYTLGANERSYTGTCLDEVIDASNVTEEMGARTYKNKKKKWVTVYDQPTGRGATINGGDGDDTIIGSDHDDIIYGGNGVDIIGAGKGNDEIYTGAGNNIIELYTGDGTDRVYSGTGNDKLVLGNMETSDDFDKKISLSTNGKDLIIQYTDSDRVILNNYFVSGHSVNKLEAANESYMALDAFINTYISTRGGKIFYDDGSAVLVKLGAGEKKPVLDNNTKYFIDATGVQLAGVGGPNDYIEVDLRNSTQDITYTGHDGNNNNNDDWVYTGSGNDVFYMNDGINVVYAGTGENTINVNKGTSSRYTSIYTLGHDTININSSNTAGVNLYFDTDTQDEIYREYDYDYGVGNENILHKIGNDLRVYYTDDIYATVKDYYTMTDEQKERVHVSGENNAGDETVADLTNLAGAYKVPLNIYMSTDRNDEQLQCFTNANINFWTNPNVARSENDATAFVINTLNKTDANATYNMHIENGGVVDLYKGTYNVYASGTTKIQMKSVGANERNRITNLYLGENSETKVKLGDEYEYVVVNQNASNSGKIGIYSKNTDTTDTEFYKYSTNQSVYGYNITTNDLLIGSGTGSWGEFYDGAVVLKNYFTANNGDGYNFAVKSSTMNYTLDGEEGNPLWDMGNAYKLYVVPEFNGNAATFITNSSFSEYVDGYKFTGHDGEDCTYKLKVNGNHIGWDTFVGNTGDEEYEFEFPEFGGLATIQDSSGDDTLKITYSHEDMNIFMDVTDLYGHIGNLYFVDGYEDIVDNCGDVVDKAIQITNYGTAANKIETIKDISNYTLNDTALAQLASDIADWLWSGGRTYECTADVFSSDNPDDISTLVQMYANANVWTPPA